MVKWGQSCSVPIQYNNISNSLLHGNISILLDYKEVDKNSIVMWKHKNIRILLDYKEVDENSNVMWKHKNKV